MTRAPKDPGWDPDNDQQVLSARIPWRERQKILAQRQADSDLPSRRTAGRDNDDQSPTPARTARSKRRESHQPTPARAPSAAATPRKHAPQRRPERDVPRASQKKNARRRKTRTAETRPGHKNIGGVGFSIKLVWFVLVVGLVGLLTVPTLVQAWRQQMDYADIKQRVAQAEANNQAMRDQLERWKDPSYVASQARARLGYVRPGETEYTVADPNQTSSDVQVARPTGPAKPWVQIMALTMQAADQTDQRDALTQGVTVPRTGSQMQSGQSGAGGAQSGGDRDALSGVEPPTIIVDQEGNPQ